MVRCLAIVVVAAACGAQSPYEQITGAPVVVATNARSTLSTRGFRLALAAQCQAQVVELWCPPRKERQSSCRKPPTVHKEFVACPPALDVKNVPVSIRAPWGAVYTAVSDGAGSVEIDVNWAQAGIDPLSDRASEQLSAGWSMSTNKSGAVALKIEPRDVELMRAAIGAATDTQYEIGAANEKATLTAQFADSALVAGRSGLVSLSIANSGPQPAYRVVAKLRSGTEAFHGLQLSFGRIDPGKSKTKTQQVVIPPRLDDRSPIVLADISYFNGDAFNTRQRFNITLERESILGVECKLATTEIAPGARVRLECELRNSSKQPARDLSVIVTVGDVVTPNVGPKKLGGGDVVKLEFIGVTSKTEKQGAQLPIKLQVAAEGQPTLEQTFSVRVTTVAPRCKAGKLTRDEYRAKRKRLQAALDAHALTQKEFDKYDAELVSCLE